MSKRVEAWYDRGWLVPTLAILSVVSALFGEDIRNAVLAGVGVILEDWVFDLFLMGGLIGLAIVLMLKSDRATRACEDLRQQLQEDLAGHRKQLSEDMADNRKLLNTALADHRKQLQEELPPLVDTKLKQISDAIATLQSQLSGLNGRVDVLDSRITALKEAVMSSTRTT